MTKFMTDYVFTNSYVENYVFFALPLCFCDVKNSLPVWFLQASMWPSIPLVVPQATLGTAMGLATSIQMVGIGVSNLVVGQILGTTSRSVIQIGHSLHCTCSS